MQQHTISTPTPWIAGCTLDESGSSEIRLLPAPENSGFVFQRGDLPSRPTVRAHWENVRSMPRWTALECEGVWVHHTEHILAALILMGIDNVIIEMNSARIPMLEGGSCAGFARALREAGRNAQSARRKVFSLSKPMFYLEPSRATCSDSGAATLVQGRYVAALPAETFSISYTFHWNGSPSLPLGFAEFEWPGDENLPQFFQARSYLVETELADVQTILGPVQHEVMLLSAGCDPALSQEAARHKIIDFIGDMGVLGHPLRGRYFAFRSGHRIHHEFIRAMIRSDALHLVEEPDA
jgi:UDP-3-O-acyl-N-acetylglucosamine deacetylase